MPVVYATLSPSSVNPFKLMTSLDPALMVMAALKLAGAAMPALDAVRAGDGDRVANGERAEAGAVDCGDLAACCHDVDRILKGLAGRAERAGIGVAAVGGDEDAVALGIRRCDRQRAGEKCCK
jgi:hypothetical protein